MKTVEPEASVAVRELYGRWTHALDGGHAELVLEDATADVVVWVSDRGTYRGAEQLRAITQARAGKLQHVVTNVLVEPVAADTVRAHAYFHLVDLATGAVVARGLYDDLVVRDGDRWCWKVKAITFQWRSDAYAASVADLRQDDHVDAPNPVGHYGAAAILDAVEPTIFSRRPELS